MGTLSFQEDHFPNPALQFLQNLGYTYLTPEEALQLRGGKTAAVISTLEEWASKKMPRLKKTGDLLRAGAAMRGRQVVLNSETPGIKNEFL